MFTAADGRQLAVDLLREIKSTGVDECLVECRYRQGRTQCDVLARYLRTVRQTGSAEVEPGFVDALTDYVGSAFERCTRPVGVRGTLISGGSRRRPACGTSREGEAPRQCSTTKAGARGTVRGDSEHVLARWRLNWVW
jgi:hypothetical protein